MRTVILERRISQRTSNKILKKQIAHIVDRALGSTRGNNWSVRVPEIGDPVYDNGMWVFNAKLHFNRLSERGDEEKQWNKIGQFIVRTTRHSSFGKYPWSVIKGCEGITVEDEPENNKKQLSPMVKDYYKTLNLHVGNHYDHIYDRTHQIRIMHGALRSAVETNFVNRYHTVLFGPPGSGKTDLLLATGNMLGKENEAYMKFDATSTTSAGAAKVLLESEYLPPVLLCEEIEKTDESSLRWLLGVLDQRAEIRRTNFRIGNKARNVKMLVFATVNDIDLFKRAMSGALASRFSNQIYCPRPGPEILAKILLREVQKINGNPKWVEPAIKFGCEEMRWYDPRKLIPLCIQGADSLFDGSYQEAIRKTQLPPESGIKEAFAGSYML